MLVLFETEGEITSIRFIRENKRLCVKCYISDKSILKWMSYKEVKELSPRLKDITQFFLQELEPTKDELDYFEMMYGKCYRDALVSFITHLNWERPYVNVN